MNNQNLNRSPKYVSDLIIDTLHNLGIEYVGMNPGATFRALHDSLVQYGGNKDPKLVLCCHEEIAVAIAEGYFRAKGKPMAVMVHDMVGLQHATKAIFEAWCDRIPMIIIGGTGPFSVEDRRPGIDWIHTSRSNANLVRDYVKWDDEPNDVTGAVEAVLRGYKIAMTPPMGPVYLCYDILVQERSLDGSQINVDPEKYRPPTPPQIEGEALSEIAQSLVDAKHPVIIADNVGRDREAYSSLIRLAELLSIPVIDKGSCLNFPNTNELNVTSAEDQVLKGADVVLAIDVPDLEEAFTRRLSRQDRRATSILSEETKLIRIGMDDYLTRGWSSDYRRLFPIDLSVTASSSVAIKAIVAKCSELQNSSTNAAKQERRAQTAELHRKLRSGWMEELQKSWNKKPISTARLASEIWSLIKSEDWVLCHGTLGGWFRRLWTLDEPERYLGHSSGTGSGVGTSIGAALARGGQNSSEVFVSVVGDGDLLYTSSSLWTAANMQVPILMVMYNNRSYYQDYGHQMVMAEQRGRDVSKVGMGINIVNPSPDFATLARAFSLNGIGPIEDPDSVLDALKKGLELVKKERKLTVVDVITQPR